MLNTTTIKVPKKYEAAIELIEKDIDGYWLYTNPGWCIETMGHGCHVASTDTQAQLMDDMRSIKECDCDKCKKGEF